MKFSHFPPFSNKNVNMSWIYLHSYNTPGLFELWFRNILRKRVFFISYTVGKVSWSPRYDSSRWACFMAVPLVIAAETIILFVGNLFINSTMKTIQLVPYKLEFMQLKRPKQTNSSGKRRGCHQVIIW